VSSGRQFWLLLSIAGIFALKVSRTQLLQSTTLLSPANVTAELEDNESSQ
jgi:hypothetical protein